MPFSGMTERKKNPTATRARLLQSAGDEFCRYGFQAARLNAIVEHSGITKGSLFHHFNGKDDLALQWLQETLPTMLESQWLQPLEQGADPLDVLKNILREQTRTIENQSAREFYGSPLATLAASITPEDLALQEAMRELQLTWHRAVSEALARGQKERLVHSAIQPSDEAHLIISLSIGLELHVKSHGTTVLPGFLRSALAYLDTLRPA